MVEDSDLEKIRPGKLTLCTRKLLTYAPDCLNYISEPVTIGSHKGTASCMTVERV